MPLWSFHLDGEFEAMPLMKGCESTRRTRHLSDYNVKAAARLDAYRGFVFAGLSPHGPALKQFLGEARAGVKSRQEASFEL